MDEKDSDKAVLKGQLKKEEKEHEKTKSLFKSSIETLQETVGNVTKINNDLKTEVSTQKELIKNLEGDRNKSKSVEANDGVQRETVDMSKENPTQTCQACDKVFKAAGDLDKHMTDKHTESECHMCNKTFTTRKEVQDHICLEGDIVPQKCKKSYCDKEFVSSTALKNHMKSSHFGHQRNVCTKCGEILSTDTNMKHHSKSCGKSGDSETTQEKSRAVCKHWRRGRCDRGSQCKFSHVGRQDAAPPSTQSTKNTVTCRNGPSCSYLARGRCHFDHHTGNRHNEGEEDVMRTNRTRRQPDQGREGQSSARAGQGRRQQSERLPCKFGADCDRVPNCPFLHSLRDFPQYDKSHGFRATKRGRNNGNQ